MCILWTSHSFRLEYCSEQKGKKFNFIKCMLYWKDSDTKQILKIDSSSVDGMCFQKNQVGHPWARRGVE